jgi:hypothetical protein
MSNRCNACTLRDMKERAAKRGATVSVVRQTSGEMRGWYEVKYSDHDEPSAWFMELTVGCCC